uniref:Rab9 effector protein with kelch motifs n=1 Tax=Labrus bergylta TaxID=56723 RepID=A0A3Q3E3Y4_9LABR
MLNEPRSLPYISRHFFPNRRGPRLAERLLVGTRRLVPRGTLADADLRTLASWQRHRYWAALLPLLIGCQTFLGVFFLSLTPPDNHEWDIPEWEGLDSRYEHYCFVPESCPQSLWVFGGAQQSGNRNCIQNVQLTETIRVVFFCRSYKDIRFHFSLFHDVDSNTGIWDHFYLNYPPASSAWSQPETQGRQPPDKHGHVIVAAGSKIYIHGGMAGDKFHNDVFSLDTKIMKWEKVQVKGDIPPGVAAHSAVALGKNIYIFGGMTAEGFKPPMLSIMFADKSRWVLMKFEGDMPPNRLDHSMCLLPWTVHAEGNGDKEQADCPTASETIHLAFVFGGMDTQGVISSLCTSKCH